MHYWQKYGFFGGHVFLDFLNTFDDIGKTRKSDAIPDWETIIAWAKQSKILNETESNILFHHSIKAIQHEIIQLRELRKYGWKLFNNIANKRKVASKDLKTLNQNIRWAYLQANLVKQGDCFSWVIDDLKTEVTLIRARLGLAAGEIMSKPIIDRLTECDGCTGIFINTGRGVGRKWCRMNTCGNRSKTSNFRSQN